MYDIAVIGGGPAGLSAAITARARNKHVLVVSNDFRQSYLAKAETIENYPGMPHVSGIEMLEIMHLQAESLGVAFMQERATSILPWGDHFSLSVGPDVIEAKTVILAFGLGSGKAFPGEAAYLGRGVSYCATCDGMLYRNKEVAVVGLSDQAPAEANFLMSIGCQVTYVVSGKTEPLLEQGITVINGNVREIMGNELGITGLMYQPYEDAKRADGEELKVLSVEGIFILRPSVAPAALLSGVELDGKLLKVDYRMRTNIPGVFAAGDCCSIPAQIAKAVGEGQIAAWSAVEYIDETK
jgi:thioredoxin reductase (NADPH)